MNPFKLYTSKDIEPNVSAADCRLIAKLNSFIDYSIGVMITIFVLLFVAFLTCVF